MGKNKKSFIDKKNSSTYHLLYRSQRDVAEEGGETLLWPSPNNNKETDQKVLIGNKNSSVEDASTLADWKRDLSTAGLVDDFDYEKHMKPITGTGDFFDASGKRGVVNKQIDARSLDVRDEITNEVERQLESIALTNECMDNDIADILFGDVDFADGDFEELNDEFVLDAAKEPEPDEEEEAFDFAAHIRRLMEKAKLEASGGQPGSLATVHEQARKDQEFFAEAKPVGHDEEEDEFAYFNENDWEIEGTPGVVPKLSATEEKALCDKFNETLAEYDSDEIGDCYEEEIVGPRPLEGDAQVEAALNDFLQEKEDDVFMQGGRHYMADNTTGGSGFSALVGTKMVPLKNLDESAPVHEDIRPIEDVLGEADGVLGQGKAAPPAEEIFIDGKSYFSEKMRNPWDCESILSTYSNLDNNPVTIGASGRRRKLNKKKGDSNSSVADNNSEQVQQILLSDKTGLPLGVLPIREFATGGEDTYVSVNKGEARSKNETKEEKNARKMQIKKEREMSRLQKKMMKEAFSQEFSKRAQDVLVDDVGGKSVFRF